MLSNACFCETVLNGSGVVPPLVLSIALLVDFLCPAKSEDALNQTWAEQRRTSMPSGAKDCRWVELRFSQQKQNYTDTSLNQMLGSGPSSRNSTAELFLHLATAFRYLELQGNLSLDFKHLGFWSTPDYWEVVWWAWERSAQSQQDAEPGPAISNRPTSNLLY